MPCILGEEYCQFREVDPMPRHENVHDAHYLYYPNRTTLSVFCPEFRPKVASTLGLYGVPDQCELHSNRLTTIANRN